MSVAAHFFAATSQTSNPLPERQRIWVSPAQNDTFVHSKKLLFGAGTTTSPVPVCVSHTRTVLSVPPETSIRPSVENARSFTRLLCPFRIFIPSHKISREEEHAP